MNVVVLIKQVLDPELPARSFRVNRELKTPDIARAPRVMSIFDGNALEVALKLKEAKGSGVRIIALSLGEKAAEEVLRKALAVTADEAVLLVDPAFAGLDSFRTAQVLAAGIKALGDVDLVIAGRQAADWEAGQVGSLVADELGWPCVPFVSRITPDGAGLTLRRELEDGYQTIQTHGPVVLTITNDESNVMRFAKVRDVMASSRKPIAQWNAAKLGLDPSSLGDSSIEVLDLFVPEATKHAEMIEGDNPAERPARAERPVRMLP